MKWEKEIVREVFVFFVREFRRKRSIEIIKFIFCVKVGVDVFGVLEGGS